MKFSSYYLLICSKTLVLLKSNRHKILFIKLLSCRDYVHIKTTIKKYLEEYTTHSIFCDYNKQRKHKNTNKSVVLIPMQYFVTQDNNK